MREIAEIARENLIVSKQKSNNYYDRFINPVQYDKNDKVGLIKKPKSGKLEKDHYQGPFDIIKVNEHNSITINYKGKAKTLHSNKLSLVNEKKIVKLFSVLGNGENIIKNFYNFNHHQI